MNIQLLVQILQSYKNISQYNSTGQLRQAFLKVSVNDIPARAKGHERRHYIQLSSMDEGCQVG